MVTARDYVYEILKMVEAGKENFTRKDLDLEQEDFIEIMQDIKNDKLVDNISFSFDSDGNPRIVYTNGLSLTKFGKEYIYLKEEGRI